MAGCGGRQLDWDAAQDVGRRHAVEVGDCTPEDHREESGGRGGAARRCRELHAGIRASTSRAGQVLRHVTSDASHGHSADVGTVTRPEYISVSPARPSGRNMVCSCSGCLHVHYAKPHEGLEVFSWATADRLMGLPLQEHGGPGGSWPGAPPGWPPGIALGSHQSRSVLSGVGSAAGSKST